MAILRLAAKCLFGALFVVAGALHLARPGPFVRIVPPYLPWPLALVYLSGVCELGLGLLLLVPRTAAFAAWGLVALLVAVFPANLHMATDAKLFPAFSPAVLWLRLPLQAVLIAWAWWYTRAP